jgi:tRNA modification GTPase
VIYCVETGRDLSSSEREFLDGLDVPVVVVETKADLTVDTAAAVDGLCTSARTGTGLVELRAELARFAFADLSARAELEPLVTRERHRAVLELALREMEGFRSARDAGVEGAVAAVHLRAAVGALENIIGAVTQDDVLDRLFSTFCVGK